MGTQRGQGAAGHDSHAKGRYDENVMKREGNRMKHDENMIEYDQISWN